MMDEKMLRVKNRVLVYAFAVIMLSLFVLLCVNGEKEYSEAERRPLASLPTLTYKDAMSGDFFDDFEEYALDQFICRDSMRTVKAAGVRLLGIRDNNKLYFYRDGIYKIEKINEESIVKCGEKIESIAKEYNGNVYYSVIPDKNSLIGEQSGRPYIDNNTVSELLKTQVISAEYIDIARLLTVENYYRTDLHWKQETILPVADELLNAMGKDHDVMQDSFSSQAIQGFCGVYYGQAALPCKSDEMIYLRSDLLDQATATTLPTGKRIEIYDQTAFDSMDPYNLYLGGPEAIIKVDNPLAPENKKLYLFRDSFGSSIAPLLIGGYSEVYLIDLRYVPSQYLDNFISFEEGNDMLFLYSYHILNESNLLR